ncbi:phosphoribosyltransferase-like protein [Methylorubrum extorquens]|uniref:phosphoribosyltransferase-like protein n=1 Tax=Methylorubrum extorquens TaxID=408 RepID=UPI0012DB6221|nr:hypothetical protein [Methylorubrum extorquens]
MKRNELLRAIATTIEDYQAGTLAAPTPEHVEKWINQFPQASQLPILSEISHVLDKTYFSRIRVRRVLRAVIKYPGWTAGDPSAFWRQVNFLDLQPRGNSQRDLLALFDKSLNKECGYGISECGQGNKFLYLDDGLFSGGRIGSDLDGWIMGPAPKNAELMVAVIALHTQGHYFTNQSLRRAIAKSGKSINLSWVHYMQIEDGLFKVSDSDVLRPTNSEADPEVKKYIASLGRNPTWRVGTSTGPKNFFSSNKGREVLEQEFLKKGIELRARCPYLNEYQRPLGNTTMKTLGFGTLFATFRNCPNNAPLVLWAGDPWYPLLRRVTN